MLTKQIALFLLFAAVVSIGLTGGAAAQSDREPQKVELRVRAVVYRLEIDQDKLAELDAERIVDRADTPIAVFAKLSAVGKTKVLAVVDDRALIGSTTQVDLTQQSRAKPPEGADPKMAMAYVTTLGVDLDLTTRPGRDSGSTTTMLDLAAQVRETAIDGSPASETRVSCSELVAFGEVYVALTAMATSQGGNDLVAYIVAYRIDAQVNAAE
jgi:hypothetical protein